jgi:mannose-1-phosphate guanylyltransferase/MurNAc alpha-1-phosphate uridylyltransferase
MDGLVGVVLAAGRGTRLRPLTRLRPKALCPVGNVPLVDLALERVRPAVEAVAVNLHHGRRAIDAHLAADVHRSVEADGPLGTAGALGRLRGWIDGRPALVVNADAWCPGSLAGFADGWDGERIRLLLAGDDELQPTSGLAGALMPWSEIERLDARPSGLYEVSWRAARAGGRLEALRHDGPFVDCGTPQLYLAANLQASSGESVVEPGAEVEGTLDRCVVWGDAEVHAGESLSCCIRARGRITVLVR